MPPLLEVRDLEVRHGAAVALHDVSLSVEADEVVGLMGPNGAGKTTLIDAVTGYQGIHAGEVRLDGRGLGGLPAHRRARLGLARTFQSLELFDDLTVRENLLVAAGTPTVWSTLTDALWPKRHDHRLVDEALALTGLAPVSDLRPTQLSNGQRPLVALARAVVGRPRLLLLDEPAAGLDVAESAALGRLLLDLPARGTTVLLVEHDMSLVLGVCDRVHVLDLGRTIASGTPTEVRTDPAVIEAYLGRSDHGAPPADRRCGTE